jgi:hypothetical protein
MRLAIYHESAMKTKPILIIALSAVLILMSTPVAMVPTAAATSSNLLLDSSTCSGIFVNGIWDSTTSTCTVSLGGNLPDGKTLNIPHGTTLAIGTIFIGGTGFLNSGTVTNDGTVAISSSVSYSLGFYNFRGTFTNLGTMTISDVIGTAEGFTNFGGTFTNLGTITISRSNIGLGNGFDFASFVNSGGGDLRGGGNIPPAQSRTTEQSQSATPAQAAWASTISAQSRTTVQSTTVAAPQASPMRAAPPSLASQSSPVSEAQATKRRACTSPALHPTVFLSLKTFIIENS